MNVVEIVSQILTELGPAGLLAVLVALLLVLGGSGVVALVVVLRFIPRMFAAFREELAAERAAIAPAAAAVAEAVPLIRAVHRRLCPDDSPREATACVRLAPGTDRDPRPPEAA